MPRRFRFLLIGKKRGDRATLLAMLGPGGEAVFFGVIAALGALAVALVAVWLIAPRLRVNSRFAETECRVTDQPFVQEVATDDGPRYLPRVPIEYEVEGQTYRSETFGIESATYSDRNDALAATTTFTPGERYPCW